MKRNSQMRKLRGILAQFNLEVIDGRKHLHIIKAGKVVYSFAGSPSCPYYAENTIHDLIRKNLIPKELRSVKIR